MNSNSVIRLTQTVKKGGCAAKVAAGELRTILAGVRFPPKDSNVLIDGDHFDDAAIIKVSDELALVQTLDFFTPTVDTPYLFGKIAAANALSDVYAMGGVPKTALAILAFPTDVFEPRVIQEVLQGACDILAEAKVSLVGGHSIDDETLKFGLSVTGYVHPNAIWTNQGARVGDDLILTKAIGTGTLNASLKWGGSTEDDLKSAYDSMTKLNDLSLILNAQTKLAIHAATDVTGFGLSGHAFQMAKASLCKLQIEFDEVPILPRAREMLREDFLTKAHQTNHEYTRDALTWVSLKQGKMSTLESAGLPIDWKLLHDPQTSGGLLLSVDPSQSAQLLQALRKEFLVASRIGRVCAQDANEPNRLIEVIAR